MNPNNRSQKHTGVSIKLKTETEDFFQNQELDKRGLPSLKFEADACRFSFL
jgi:hypothetical protein